MAQLQNITEDVLEHVLILGKTIYRDDLSQFCHKPNFRATCLLAEHIETNPATSFHIYSKENFRDSGIISVIGKQGICWLIWPGSNHIYGIPLHQYKDIEPTLVRMSRSYKGAYCFEPNAFSKYIPMISTCFTPTRGDPSLPQYPMPDNILSALFGLMNDNHDQLETLVSLPYSFSNEMSWKGFCLNQLGNMWNLHGFDSCDRCNEMIEDWDEAWSGNEDGIYKQYCKQCDDILLGNHITPFEYKQRIAESYEQSSVQTALGYREGGYDIYDTR